MRNLLLCALLLAQVPPMSAQPPGIEQGSELLIVPPDDKFLRWEGHPGRTYFLQISIGSDPLVEWHWMPVIDSGTGVEISYEVEGTGPRGFYRLHYTDESCPPASRWRIGTLTGTVARTKKRCPELLSPIRSSIRPPTPGYPMAGRSPMASTRTTLPSAVSSLAKLE